MDEKHLAPATEDEIEFALAFALRHNGRKAYRQTDEAMAKIVAAHLREQLLRMNLIVMRGPPAPALTTPAGPVRGAAGHQEPDGAPAPRARE